MHLKAIKIRLYPDKTQQIEINKLLGSTRFAYNYCLNLKIKQYEKDKSSLNITQLYQELTKLKNTEEKSWLKETHSKVLQQTLINLDTAYKNFFKHGFGFPTFKKKQNNNSCRFPVDAVSGVRGNRFDLITKIKNVLFKCSVRDEKYLNKHQANIKSATLTKTCVGHYMLSVLIENKDKDKDKNKEENKFAKSYEITGIDVGIKDFVITSKGDVYENIKSTRNNSKKLKKLHKKLSNKELVSTNEVDEKGKVIRARSKNREKARLELSKRHLRIKNKKEYYLHFVVNRLLNENQVVVIEDLNLAGIVRNHNLAKSILELSLGDFKRILKYKALWNDKQVVEIGRYFPSSKMCHCCGFINKNLTLKDREWKCSNINCHVVHDRDLNAAINIENEGIRLMGQKLEPVPVPAKLKARSKIKEKIGLSKPELRKRTLVESSSVDDPVDNVKVVNMLKSTYSLKQEDKTAKFINVIDDKILN